MDIYITQLDTGTTISLPMLPEQLQMQSETRFATYDIMHLGEIRLPLGEKLKSFSWEGILPGESRKNEPFLQYRWRSPQFISAKELGVTPQRLSTQTSSYNGATRANQQQQNVYTVKKGDSLWSIAQKLLGKGSRYGEIYQYNRATIDSKNGNSQNKYQIYPGQVLKIPK